MEPQGSYFTPLLFLENILFRILKVFLCTRDLSSARTHTVFNFILSCLNFAYFIFISSICLFVFNSFMYVHSFPDLPFPSFFLHLYLLHLFSLVSCPISFPTFFSTFFSTFFLFRTSDIVKDLTKPLSEEELSVGTVIILIMLIDCLYFYVLYMHDLHLWWCILFEGNFYFQILQGKFPRGNGSSSAPQNNGNGSDTVIRDKNGLPIGNTAQSSNEPYSNNNNNNKINNNDSQKMRENSTDKKIEKKKIVDDDWDEEDLDTEIENEKKSSNSLNQSNFRTMPTAPKISSEKQYQLATPTLPSSTSFNSTGSNNVRLFIFISCHFFNFFPRIMILVLHHLSIYLFIFLFIYLSFHFFIFLYIFYLFCLIKWR